MQIHNDLQQIKTSLLERMIHAYYADYGRILTIAELTERKKTITFLQAEIESRKKIDPVHAVIL
jgi:hypothetical protein